MTDLVEIFNRHRLKVTALPVADSREVLGANDRVELAQIEKLLRLRKAMALMREGVTVVDPQATYIDPDVEVGRDTVIEPGVSLLGGRAWAATATSRHHCTITDSSLADRVTGAALLRDHGLGSWLPAPPSDPSRACGRAGDRGERANRQLCGSEEIARGSRQQGEHLTYLGDATVASTSTSAREPSPAITTA